MFEFDVEIDPVQRPEFDHDGPTPDPVPDSIPSLTKMLVLAHQIHRAVEASPLTDYAEIARQIGVSRARVSQIIRLRQLAPAIQDVILCEPDRIAHLRERHVRHNPDKVIEAALTCLDVLVIAEHRDGLPINWDKVKIDVWPKSRKQLR